MPIQEKYLHESGDSEHFKWAPSLPGDRLFGRQTRGLLQSSVNRGERQHSALPARQSRAFHDDVRRSPAADSATQLLPRMWKLLHSSEYGELLYQTTPESLESRVYNHKAPPRHKKVRT